VLPALVQASLCAPSDLDHARVLALLAAGERLADARLVAVVVGGLDQQPAGVAGAGLGDRALAALAVGGALGGHHPEEAGQLAGALEAGEVADLGAQAGGRERVDAPEAAQPGDHWGVAGLVDRLLERLDQPAAATGEQLDSGQVSTNVACEQASSNSCERSQLRCLAVQAPPGPG